MAEQTDRKKWTPVEGNLGLACRKCGCRHFYVIYTRPKKDGIMRRKQCRHCGRRTVTWERQA